MCLDGYAIPRKLAWPSSGKPLSGPDQGSFTPSLPPGSWPGGMLPALRERGLTVGRIGMAGLAVVRPRAFSSGQCAMGQGGPVAGASNGSTGGSPMKKPRTWRSSSGFNRIHSQVLSGFLFCSE